MDIKFKRLTEHARSPYQANTHDAGYDLIATTVKRVGLFKYVYGTGLAFEIPEGYEGQIRARSSVHKTGMILCNCVGTIDSGYRGEVMAMFWKIPFIGKKYAVGDRICQMLIKPVVYVKFNEAATLSDSDRGDGGFGSSGK